MRMKQLLMSNPFINNRFFTWLDNQTLFTRTTVKVFIIYNAFWLGVLIRIYIMKI